MPTSNRKQIPPAKQQTDSPMESEQAKANALFLSIGEGAISTDGQGNVDRVNQVALDLLGFSEEELVGTWYPRTVVAVNEDNEPLDISERPITRAFISGHSVTDRCFFRRKDGTPFPVFLTVSPIMLDGKPIGAVEVFRDYTNELEIERAKDEFIAIASHQLRTPLTAIRMYSEMLARGYGGPLNSEQKKYIHAVNVSIIRMATLIDSLLSVARIESGHVRVKHEPTNPSKVVGTLITELDLRFKEKLLTIDTKLEDIRNLKTDPILFKEVLANLLTNAIKYTPPKGSVRVEISKKRNYLMVAVGDTGYGIPKAEQKHVFGKFYRGSNIVSRDTDGTGIGLYLVRRIVETLGGEIWFDSKEHKGTTFYVTLPLSAVPAKKVMNVTDARAGR
jgi:PAS domain S-box-containing protein